MSALIPEGYIPYLIGGGVVATSVIILLMKRISTYQDGLLVDVPKDTVVLQQVPRGPYAPSLSPFPLKLETYLQMTKIPYKNVFGMSLSPKTNKTPWAQFNGEILSDSQLIIEHLNKYFNIDSMSHLSPVERSTARAFLKMVEEASYWYAVRWRYEFDSEKFVVDKGKVPSVMVKMIQQQMKKTCYSQGSGRFPREEIMHFFWGDIEAVSLYLGEKKFLTGDKPCDLDCAVFGLLAQVKWHMPDSPLLDIMSKYPNLHAYCDRMKETFWPDWDDCITHGGTREAPK